MATPREELERLRALSQQETPRQELERLRSMQGGENGNIVSTTGGMVDTGIQDVEQRRRGMIEALPELGSGGLLAGEDKAKIAAISPVLLATPDPREMANILSSTFPNVGVSETPEGELIARNNKTGATVVVNKPGISKLDVLQGLGIMAAFAGGGVGAAGVSAGKGLATRAGAQALGAAGTQAAIETAQAATGGEFEEGEVALAGGIGAASEYVSPVFQALRQTIRPIKQPGRPRVEPTMGNAVDDAIQGNKPTAPINEETVKSGPTPETADYEEIRGLLKKGKARLAAMNAMPDREIKEAADDLGVVLTPGAYANNRAFREAEQALKSVPGSTISTREANAIVELGKRSDELIEKMGGTRDLSLIDNKLQNEYLEIITDLELKADDAYKLVDDVIPKVLKVEPKTSKQYIKKRLEELGGDESLLSLAEKQLLRFSKSETPPTYAALDSTRKNVGRGFKGKGIFKDDEEGILNQVYRVLSEDQQGIADAIGVGAEYAAARKLVQSRKQLEDEAISLFGRNFNDSLIPKFRGAATALTIGDISKLDKLMGAVPDHRRQEVAAAMLSEIFTAGARSNKEGVGQGFVNAYANLNRNKLAKDAIFKYLPKEARERFDKIGKVATGLFRAKNLENTSRTARDIISAMDDGGMFSKIYGVGSKVAAAEGVSTSVGLPGVGAAGVLGAALVKSKEPATQAADKLLTSKAFEKAMVKAMNNAEKEAENIITKSDAFKNWIKQADSETVAQITRMGFIPWLTQREENEQVQ